MRRRVVLLGSLLASVAAHAAALAALSSRAQDTPPPRPRLPIDVELVAPPPVRGPGSSQPPAPGAVAVARPRAEGAARRGAVRGASLAAREPRPAIPIASRQPLREVPAPPDPPAPPAEPRESARASPLAAVTRGEPGQPGEPDDDRSAGAAAHVAGLADAPGAGGAAAAEGARWKGPEPAERDCVQERVRLPASLRGFVSGTFSVKFAVAPDGKPGELEILGNLPDERVGGILLRAIQGCRWTPGTDVQGRPAKVWIVMPVRFERG